MIIKKFLKRIRGFIKGRGYKKFGLTSNIVCPIRIIGKKYISIGENVFILHGLRMEAISNWNGKNYTPDITISDDVTIGQNCHFTCANKIKIGHGVSVFADVLITDIEHQYVTEKSTSNTGLETGSVIIGDYATIGMGARILGHKNISIGKNAVIGANAVVLEDIPDNSIAVGIPARVVKQIDTSRRNII